MENRPSKIVHALDDILNGIADVDTLYRIIDYIEDHPRRADWVVLEMVSAIRDERLDYSVALSFLPLNPLLYVDKAIEDELLKIVCGEYEYRLRAIAAASLNPDSPRREEFKTVIACDQNLSEWLWDDWEIIEETWGKRLADVYKEKLIFFTPEVALDNLQDIVAPETLVALAERVFQEANEACRNSVFIAVCFIEYSSGVFNMLAGRLSQESAKSVRLQIGRWLAVRTKEHKWSQKNFEEVKSALGRNASLDFLINTAINQRIDVNAFLALGLELEDFEDRDICSTVSWYMPDDQRVAKRYLDLLRKCDAAPKVPTCTSTENEIMYGLEERYCEFESILIAAVESFDFSVLRRFAINDVIGEHEPGEEMCQALSSLARHCRSELEKVSADQEDDTNREQVIRDVLYWCKKSRNE